MGIKVRLIIAKIKEMMSKGIWLINFFIPKDRHQMIFYSKPQYSDNSRALFEEMLNQGYGEKYKMTWAVKDPEKMTKLFPNVDFVQHRSLKGFWLFLRSKYIFATHSFWVNRYVKKRQVFVNLWHGMMLKRVGALEFGKRTNIQKYDIMPVTSEFYRIIVSKVFNSTLDSNSITGLPRNDYLYQGKDILKQMGINSDDKKIILWMPTFRGSNHRATDGVQSELGLPVLNSENVNILNDFLVKNNMFIIVKLHQFEEKKFMKNRSYSNIIYVNDEIIPKKYNLYNLVGVADCLLTDYSGIYVDFLNLDRPIGFVYDDLDEYKRSRGFIFERIEDLMPGKHIKSFEELISFMSEIAANKDEYSGERKIVNTLFNRFSDNKNSVRVIELLKMRYFDKD